MSSKGSMIQGALASGLIVWVLMLGLVWECFGDTAVVALAWSSIVIGLVSIIAWGWMMEDDEPW